MDDGEPGDVQARDETIFERPRAKLEKNAMPEDDDKLRGKAVGGRARADKLPPERRSEIAKQAADGRWKTEPLELTEDVETGDRFVLYSKPIADLFGIT